MLPPNGRPTNRSSTRLPWVAPGGRTKRIKKAAEKRQIAFEAEEPREILPFRPLHLTTDHLLGTSDRESGLLLDSDPLLPDETSPLEESFAPAELMAFDEPLLETPTAPALAESLAVDRNSQAAEPDNQPAPVTNLRQTTVEAQAPLSLSFEQPSAAPLTAAIADSKVATPAGGPTMPQPTGETRALSDFVGAPPVRDAFCPRLEVERFLWPTAVQSLIACSGPAVETFAAQLLADAARGEKTLAITGGRRSQGRTTLTLLLAKQIGLMGGRVIVVDADFERPLVSRALGVDAPWGWDQAVTGEISLDEAIVTSVGDRVAMLPWNVKRTPTSNAFDDLRAAACLGLLREHYDLVLVDAGPLPTLDAPSELRRLAGVARFDGCYVVNDGRAGATPALADILTRADGLAWQVFGVLENYSPLASGESVRMVAA